MGEISFLQEDGVLSLEGLKALMVLNGCESLKLNVWQRLCELGAPEELFGGSKALYEELGLSDKMQAAVKRAVSSGWADRELQRCNDKGIDVIPWGSSFYPEFLGEIAEPPMLLYVRGSLSRFLNGRHMVGVVGTRRASSYGLRVAKALGGRLAGADVTLISGGARGVDGSAHDGCLKGFGSSVAVLGCGVDVVWPKGHEALFEEMAASGALVSEYPLGASGRPWRFPRRNRIIVGMANCVVVVESPHKGGSMITARLAMEQGREIWAVPGRIDEDICSGSNALIAEGASPLVNLDDFIQAVTGLGNLVHFEGDVVLDEVSRRVLELIKEKGDRTVDELCDVLGESVVAVQNAISELASSSFVYASGPGRWRASL